MSTGARLRRARLDRGLTLDQVSDTTKIQLWILHAIERDELSHVPGGVFIRGYLAAFARAVGVDANEILTEHFGPLPPPAVLQAPDVRRPVYTGTPLWQAAALIVLVIATAVVWSQTWRDDGDGAGKTAGASSAPLTLPLLPASRPLPAVPASAITTTTPAVVSVAKSIAEATPAPIRSSDVTATSGSFDVAPVAPEPDAAAASEARLVVQLHATGDVWVEATADGERQVYRLFKPGEDLQVDAQKEVHLVIGDASAATYTVNGVPSGPLGGIGVVREITLTP